MTRGHQEPGGIQGAQQTGKETSRTRRTATRTGGILADVCPPDDDFADILRTARSASLKASLQRRVVCFTSVGCFLWSAWNALMFDSMQATFNMLITEADMKQIDRMDAIFTCNPSLSVTHTFYRKHEHSMTQGRQPPFPKNSVPISLGTLPTIFCHLRHPHLHHTCIPLAPDAPLSLH